MSSTCKPAISTSITLNQTMQMRFFSSFRAPIFSREHTSVKTLTKIILISYSGKKLQRCHCQKKLPSFLSFEQHFAGIFFSEAMTLPEIDHVSFFAEHARVDVFRRRRIVVDARGRTTLRWKVVVRKLVQKRHVKSFFLGLLEQRRL